MWVPRTNFNPRPREGDDPVPLQRYAQATNFNPRHREGDDILSLEVLLESIISIHVTAKVTTAKIPKYPHHFLYIISHLPTIYN